VTGYAGPASPIHGLKTTEIITRVLADLEPPVVPGAFNTTDIDNARLWLRELQKREATRTLTYA
jgi:hypothetical protein